MQHLEDDGKYHDCCAKNIFQVIFQTFDSNSSRS